MIDGNGHSKAARHRDRRDLGDHRRDPPPELGNPCVGHLRGPRARQATRIGREALRLPAGNGANGAKNPGSSSNASTPRQVLGQPQHLRR